MLMIKALTKIAGGHNDIAHSHNLFLPTISSWPIILTFELFMINCGKYSTIKEHHLFGGKELPLC